jgi:3-hydroxyacyl-CoA dehydrogenase/enoyl-CoA hydratase/3-hydroxybutyryl-CoA epimerase
MSQNALSLTIDDGIAIITFDLAGESVNKFSAAVIAEFDTILTKIETDKSVKAAVLISGKPDNFIAGADIDAFLEFKTAKDAEQASAQGHRAMARIEKSRAPIIAAINGACLGGGLEAALACAYRIGTEHPKTVLALPEVQLGLIPGAGGTQRLPKTIGLQGALDMILTGKNVRAKKALQIGLIDELVHPSILRDVAIQRAREIASGKRRHEEKKHGAKEMVLEDNPIGRAVVFRQAREMTMKKSRGHYPALP